MKSKTLLIAILGIFGIWANQACNSGTTSDSPFAIAGDSITTEGAVAVANLPELLAGSDSIQCKLEGEITAVCQTKGCWMKMPLGEGQDVRIKFKDYGFFVPMNSSGRNAFIEGYAYVDSVSVSELRHLAKDAGESEDEIAAIDRGTVEYTFMASGVIIE